jgi:hypothetical protein
MEDQPVEIQVVEPELLEQKQEEKKYSQLQLNKLCFKFGTKDNLIHKIVDYKLAHLGQDDDENLHLPIDFRKMVYPWCHSFDNTKITVECPIAPFNEQIPTFTIEVENARGVTPMDILTAVNEFYLSPLTEEGVKAFDEQDEGVEEGDEDYREEYQLHVEKASTLAERGTAVWADLMGDCLYYDNIYYCNGQCFLLRLMNRLHCLPQPR